MIKLKLKNITELNALLHLVDHTINTGSKYHDNLVNSIIEELSIKLQRKLLSDSLTFKVTLRKYEAIAIYTLWFEYTKHYKDYTNLYQVILQEQMTSIHRKIV